MSIVDYRHYSRSTVGHWPLGGRDAVDIETGPAAADQGQPDDAASGAGGKSQKCHRIFIIPTTVFKSERVIQCQSHDPTSVLGVCHSEILVGLGPLPWSIRILGEL